MPVPNIDNICLRCENGVHFRRAVGVAQLVRALDCGSRGWGFETPHSPHLNSPNNHYMTPEIPI